MKTIVILLGSCLDIASVGFSADDSGTPQKTTKKETFLKLDTNGDGSLSPDEFAAGKKNPAKAAKTFKETDSSGSLSLAEFSAKKKSGTDDSAKDDSGDE